MAHRQRAIAASVLALAFAAAALAGCTATAQSGSAAVFVKDAPSDAFAHVDVSFTQVEVHREPNATSPAPESGEANETHAAGDEPNETGDARDRGDHGDGGKDGARPPRVDDGQWHDGDAREEDRTDRQSHDDDRGSWVTVASGNFTVDLKNFSGSAKAFLGDADLAPGTYDGIRVTITMATAQLANGTLVHVKVPSGALRIRGQFTVATGQETDLTLDFDLAHSIVETGHGSYILKPVLRLAADHRERPHDDERQERARRRDDEDRHERDGLGHRGD